MTNFLMTDTTNYYFFFYFFILLISRQGEPQTSLCGTLGFYGTQAENHCFTHCRNVPLFLFFIVSTMSYMSYRNKANTPILSFKFLFTQNTSIVNIQDPFLDLIRDKLNLFFCSYDF